MRADNTLGLMLRSWRVKRSRSQLALSLDLGVSQRHISFIESGRSAPSRSLLTAMAQALDIPFRDRNGLLLAAGLAPVYSHRAWDPAETRAVNKALERMLRQHAPFPAIVMDRYWNVLLSNDFAPRFFGHFIDMSARRGQRNLLRLLFDADGMRPFIANWAQVSKSLLERISRESTDSPVVLPSPEVAIGRTP
jgi:transcriptional regulator with XRE-family HTH domain